MLTSPYYDHVPDRFIPSCTSSPSSCLSPTTSSPSSTIDQSSEFPPWCLTAFETFDIGNNSPPVTPHRLRLDSNCADYWTAQHQSHKDATLNEFEARRRADFYRGFDEPASSYEGLDQHIMLNSVHPPHYSAASQYALGKFYDIDNSTEENCYEHIPEENHGAYEYNMNMEQKYDISSCSYRTQLTYMNSSGSSDNLVENYVEEISRDGISSITAAEDAIKIEQLTSHVNKCTEGPAEKKSLIISSDPPATRPCLVCADVASGQHYGAASCEACKAFFKRSVQGNISYSCLANGRCVMTKRGRKACQACRYQKCVQVGMLKEGIRSDRHRGGQHKVHSQRSEGIGGRPTNQMLTATNGVNRLLNQLLKIEPPKVYACPELIHSDTKEHKLTATLSNLADRELVATVCWAKQIPGFSALAVADRMSLFHCSWADVLSLNIAFRSTPYDGHLVFADDFRVTAERSVQLGVPVELDTRLRRLAKRLTDMEVTQEEYVLLKAIILVHTDVFDVSDKSGVQRIHDCLYSSLIQYEQTRNRDSYRRRVGYLLLVLPLVVCARLHLLDYWAAVKQTGIQQRLLREMVNYSCQWR